MISASWSKHLSTYISCNNLFQFEQDSPFLIETQNRQVMHLQTKTSNFYSIIEVGGPRKSFIVEVLFCSVHHSVLGGGFLLSVQITVLKGSAEF